MLSDADLVMEEIEYLTNASDFVPKAKAMLNHLYELHRLRDAIIHRDLKDELKFSYFAGKPLLGVMEYDQFEEMQDA